MLSTYLQVHYPNETVLVVYAPALDAGQEAWSELKSIQKELGLLIFGQANTFLTNGFLLVTMDENQAIAFTNRYDHGLNQIEVWTGGECIHENR
jgi:hypothetical protein